MAYVDLISSGVTLVAGGSAYDFAFDTNIANDNGQSPHITHIGVQLDLTVATGPTITSTSSHLLSEYRVKVGSTEIMNFDDPIADANNTDIGNIGVMAQKLGGVDSIEAISATELLTELTFPVGLDASKSHRINMHLKLLNESTWCGKALAPATSNLNIIIYYGTATESCIIGSRQDYELTSGSTRTLTVYGMKSWSMLGVFMINSVAAVDGWTKARLNNGAFRELKMAQWRVISGTGWKSPLRYIDNGAAPQWRTVQLGNIFLDLKRLTAGASVDLAVTAATTNTTSLFPVWVSPIGQTTPKPNVQTVKSITNVTENVTSQSEN